MPNDNELENFEVFKYDINMVKFLFRKQFCYRGTPNKNSIILREYY